MTALDAADVAEVFFDEDMPGYVKAQIGADQVAGLFSEMPKDAFGVSGVDPVLTVPAAAAEYVEQGTDVWIGETRYTIAAMRTTRHVTRLTLEATE